MPTTKKPHTAQIASTLTVTKAKASFSAVLARASYQGQRIVIKKGTRAAAVILGYEDYQRLVDLEDRYESALLAKSLKDDRFLRLDEVTKRLGL
jgi:prevent-host-death family protein